MSDFKCLDPESLLLLPKDSEALASSDSVRSQKEFQKLRAAPLRAHEPAWLSRAGFSTDVNILGLGLPSWRHCFHLCTQMICPSDRFSLGAAELIVFTQSIIAHSTKKEGKEERVLIVCWVTLRCPPASRGEHRQLLLIQQEPQMWRETGTSSLPPDNPLRHTHNLSKRKI